MSPNLCDPTEVTNEEGKQSFVMCAILYTFLEAGIQIDKYLQKKNDILI